MFKWFFSLFSPVPDSSEFWRNRVFSLEEELKNLREKHKVEVFSLEMEIATLREKHEIELKEEREKRDKELIRNRKREDLLQDKILVSKGLHGISKQIESDLNFNLPPDPNSKTLTPEQQRELKFFVEDCVKRGITAEEAEKHWREKNL